jgi:putative lipoic acid-binding regulatory protein
MRRFPENSRPDIRYPARWTYTVIGVDRHSLEGAVTEVVEDRSHKLSLSNVSSGGRYVSLRLTLIVLNEAERLHIFESLRKHAVVKMVL